MLKIKPFKTALFDCDGVILDSNKIKSNAFSASLAGEDPKLVRDFIRYHQENGGVSRYVKFEHFFRNIKNANEYEADLKFALERYAHLSYQGLLKSQEVLGVRKMLELLRRQSIPCFVVSGGDEKEVKKVLLAKNLAQYFTQIYGSPSTKSQHIDDIASRGQLNRPCIYFGDAKSDYWAATQNKIDFVFISGQSEWTEGKAFCQKNSIPHFDHFIAFMNQTSWSA